MASIPDPFWYPNIDFTAFHEHEQWAKRVRSIQDCLDCEPWQAWLVLMQLVQTNTVAAEVICAKEERREPWETDEDGDDDE